MSYLVVFFRNQGALGASIFVFAALVSWLFFPGKYLTPVPFFLLMAAWWFLVFGGFKVFGALRTLHSVGGDLNALDKDGKPILVPGQSIDAIDSKGNAALHRAVDNNDFGAVRYLLAQGANVNIRNDKYQTPLHLAVGFLKKNVAIVDALIEGGAQVNAIDSAGETPLKNAVGWEWLQGVERLTSSLTAAEINNAFGMSTALGYAARSSSFVIFAHLLSKGAAINAPDGYSTSDTPLHDAAKKGNFRMVQALIDAGADPYTTNAKGKTALDLATVPPVQMILREAMAKGER